MYEMPIAWMVVIGTTIALIALFFFAVSRRK